MLGLKLNVLGRFGPRMGTGRLKSHPWPPLGEWLRARRGVVGMWVGAGLWVRGSGWESAPSPGPLPCRRGKPGCAPSRATFSVDLAP